MEEFEIEDVKDRLKESSNSSEEPSDKEQANKPTYGSLSLLPEEILTKIIAYVPSPVARLTSNNIKRLADEFIDWEHYVCTYITKDISSAGTKNDQKQKVANVENTKQDEAELKSARRESYKEYFAKNYFRVYEIELALKLSKQTTIKKSLPIETALTMIEALKGCVINGYEVPFQNFFNKQSKKPEFIDNNFYSIFEMLMTLGIQHRRLAHLRILYDFTYKIVSLNDGEFTAELIQTLKNRLEEDITAGNTILLEAIGENFIRNNMRFDYDLFFGYLISILKARKGEDQANLLLNILTSGSYNPEEIYREAIDRKLFSVIKFLVNKIDLDSSQLMAVINYSINKYVADGVQARQKLFVNICSVFVTHPNFDITAIDSEKNNSLLVATGKKCSELIEVILNSEQIKSLDIDSIKKDGQTALHLACANTDLFSIELLLKNGAKMSEVDSNNQTPFYRLAESNGLFAEYIKRFMSDPDIDLDHQDNNGETLLHAVAVKGRFNLIELLLMLQARPDLRNKNGKLPSDLVTRQVLTESESLCLKILKQAEINQGNLQKNLEAKMSKEFSPIIEKNLLLTEEKCRLASENQHLHKIMGLQTAKIEKLQAQLVESKKINKQNSESDNEEAEKPQEFKFW